MQHQRAQARRVIAVILAVLSAICLAGCSTTTVEVQGQFPRSAVVEKLPLRIGVYFDEAFRTYTLTEPVPQRGDWVIAMGNAQVEAFRAVLPSMFTSVVELDDPAAPADVDAVLVPRVDEMQFAIPFQTKTNFFEIWIRYQLTLLEPGSDTVIASWPLTGYGRTREEMLDSAQVAITEAAVVALRDAAAFLAIDFAATRELAGWLARMTDEDAAEAIPPPSDDPRSDTTVPASPPAGR
ncbi:MAG TPA: hypothetical protein VLA56_16065 [Pseudomonadales bacterium]|nr:hypothetical protein [Pseudomonadales bacterium]